MTHHHADHSTNVIPVAARAKAPLYAHIQSFGTKQKLSKKERERRKVHLIPFDDEETFQINAINVTPIAIPHDAGPTFGFQFEYQGIKAGFFPDLGSTEVLEKWVPDMHYLILEANYDPEMLNQGPYPQALINRIAGPKGHLSNNQSAELLKKSASNNLQELILAHLSKHNNNPQIALKTIKPHVKDKVNVTVAPAIGPLSIGY